ncbi:type I-E CRISPR-associated protein Cas6/Cse3/CasE [Nonomuraea sp. NPDC050478]|uniref:type I-E CRISPR-associated protein Cas6/Cse3/CasE n=1 Tax=Nonomuraea sp. NPDC050478 TaxID=3364365 RepID=UPI0037ABA692
MATRLGGTRRSPAEHLPAFDPAFQGYDGPLVVIGWSLRAGLVRPMTVVVIGILTEHRPQPVVLSTATFEGKLRVTDTAAFTERLLGGIGPAKSYGCGLLTLAPLHGPRVQAD